MKMKYTYRILRIFSRSTMTNSIEACKKNAARMAIDEFARVCKYNFY